MAKKPLNKPPSKTKENLKTIAAIFGILVGAVALINLYISMMNPLRDKFNDCEKRYDVVVRDNKDLKNSNTSIEKELEKTKTQLEQANLENKKIQDKLNKKQSEADRLTRSLNQSKKEPEKIVLKDKNYDTELGEKIPNNEETAEHLNTFERPKESNPYDFDVWYIPINESKSYFSGEINIILISLDKNNRVTGKISSPGYPDIPINNGFVGQSLMYNSKNDYNIHIAKIYNNKNYSWVKFTIKKIHQSGKGKAYVY